MCAFTIYCVLRSAGKYAHSFNIEWIFRASLFWVKLSMFDNFNCERIQGKKILKRTARAIKVKPLSSCGILNLRAISFIHRIACIEVDVFSYQKSLRLNGTIFIRLALILWQRYIIFWSLTLVVLLCVSSWKPTSFLQCFSDKKKTKQKKSNRYCVR